MKFQMSLADEAKEIIKMAWTSSKSSKLDKAINTQVQELLNLIKSNAEINGMDLQPEDYLHIRTYRSSIRKAIQDIDNPWHDLSQKKEINALGIEPLLKIKDLLLKHMVTS